MKSDNEFPLPVWGGIECSVNRVGERWYDQLAMTGFYASGEFLKAVKACNIRTLRFPLLWEKHEPIKDAAIDWTWAESQLSWLRAENIEPVVGLLHHGSGPQFTDLADEYFPELFAAYAAKVAGKFPSINYYTPINEPLTTARFSGLYGLWFPHKKTDADFLIMLLNQLKGIVLAMREIRKFNPGAKLVQTEDLGKTYTSALLKYQGDFENNRRWLTYDILSGRFDEGHALWNYVTGHGIKKEALLFFTNNPCDIAVIGVNYYITSERYLDEDLHKYSPATHGGNGVHAYADVEAARVDLQEPHGPGPLLKELWERYGLPIAITEVHLHCYREEQIRWLKYIYNAATEALRSGINIIAVTSWALFGSFGWDKLLTSFPGNYETSAFDISNGKIRFTALARLITALNNGKDTFKDMRPDEGWWRCNTRFYEPVRKKQAQPLKHFRPILIMGKTGTLGYSFSEICRQRKFNFLLTSREEADVLNYEQTEKAIRKYNPAAVINATGFVNIDRAETEPENCYAVNNSGNQNLGILCEKYGIKFLTFSTDQVFDGHASLPYTESSPTNPLNVYGHSKVLAENFISKVNPAGLIIRTSAFFGPWDKYNFVTQCLKALRAGLLFEAADNTFISPTYLPHLVNASMDLLLDDEKGIWHLANRGKITWYDWARQTAERAGLDRELIIPRRNENHLAARPKYSVLSSEKYALMPDLENGMEDYFSSYYVKNIHKI